MVAFWGSDSSQEFIREIGKFLFLPDSKTLSKSSSNHLAILFLQPVSKPQTIKGFPEEDIYNT